MSKIIHLVDLASAGNFKGLRERNLRLLDAADQEAQGLKVSILATCSGSLVNGRVYKGTEMMAGCDSWVKPYARPILTHHASGGSMLGPPPDDPKGRVESAVFTQLRKGRGFENDFKRPDVGGKGSGFITVEAMITDPDAVQKILDGRYLTVSSGQSTTSMVCSICGTDWFDDYCEHRPGRDYEIETGSGKRKKKVTYNCYGIAGPLTYRELSFVNVPAQANAQVLGVLEKDDQQDSLNLMTMSDHNAIQEVALCDAEGNIIQKLAATQEESEAMGDLSKKVLVEMPGTKDEELDEELESKVEEGNEDENKIDDATPDADDSTEDSEEETPANSETENEGEEEADDVAMSDEHFALANVAKSIKDNGLLLEQAVPTYDGMTEEVEIDKASHSHLVLLQKTEDGNIVGRTYATIGEVEDHEHVVDGEFEKSGVADGVTRDADSGPNHTHNFQVEVSEDDLGDISDLIKSLEAAIEDEEDAKLSAAQRKKLSSSAFCGPNRSFPAHDCAHVTAARRLIGRYKGDAATKARIMRCVERKAKSMSCGTSAKKKKKKDEADNLAAGVSLKPHRDEADIKALAEADAKIKTLEANLTEKSNEIKALEDDLTKEIALRVSDLANTFTIVRMILVKPDCVGIDSLEKFEEKVKSYGDRTADSLRDAISDLLPELDLTIRNLKKSKADRIIAPAQDKEEKSKAPAKHVDSTNKGPKKARRKEKRGAEQLAEDLD